MAYYDAATLKTLVPALTTKGVADELIDGYVAEFEATAERYRGVAYEPREATFTGDDPARHCTLILPHMFVREVTEVSIDGTPVTGSDLTAITDTLNGEEGTIERSSGWSGRIVVTYTHGLDEPPAAVLRACRYFVRAKAMDEASDKPREITGYTDDSGWTYRVGTPDWDAGRPTGVMEADQALNSLPDYRLVGIA